MSAATPPSPMHDAQDNGVFQIGLNALANSSRTPVDVDMLLSILTTGDGPGNLVRALFEDCDLESLQRMSIAAGVSSRQLRAAYAVARQKHAARNHDLEFADTI